MATLRVTPVTAQDHAFVEWWTTFDCAAEEQERWEGFFAAEVFAPALAALAEYSTKAERTRRVGPWRRVRPRA